MACCKRSKLYKVETTDISYEHDTDDFINRIQNKMFMELIIRDVKESRITIYPRPLNNGNIIDSIEVKFLDYLEEGKKRIFKNSKY